MKYLVVSLSLLVVGQCSPQAAVGGPGASAADPGSQDVKQRPEYHVRTLPADQLRDFPGLCFGSTTFRFYRLGESWPLSPFCGMATCTTDTISLMEQVTECRIPKDNPKCKVVNLVDREKQFPACCPKFECEEGVTLEYPTAEELEALAQQAQQAQFVAAALQQQQLMQQQLAQQTLAQQNQGLQQLAQSQGLQQLAQSQGLQQLAQQSLAQNQVGPLVRLGQGQQTKRPQRTRASA